MTIRKLLLGATATIAATTGVRAADAIVVAEPEPMEYVRICDIYDGNFFYIPGTETCIDIGGYIRYEMRHGVAFDGGDLTKLARFAPSFTVKNETEWGTLTGYAEVEFDWAAGIASSSTEIVGFDPVTGDVVTATTTSVGSETRINLYQAFIQLETTAGTLLVGRTDNPYARFLGYAGPTIWEGRYPLVNSGEVSYTYTAGGFTGILAAVQIAQTQEFEPGIEAGAKFEGDWGSIGAIGGYDTFADSWGARAVGRAAFGAVSARLQVFYSSDDTPGIYHLFDPAGQVTEWSVLAGASAALTDKVGVAAVVQWFDTDAWEVSANLPLTPVAGLAVTPEMVYQNVDGFDDSWSGRIRFQRNF